MADDNPDKVWPKSVDNQAPTLELARLRVEYRARSLSESDIDPDPILQFSLWFEQTLAAQAKEPNAMTLATCGKGGAPSARIVLLKGVDASGFTFFTNYRSRKSLDLEENNRAAVVFWWPELERQVRIEGTVAHTSEAESDDYFNRRPVESRIGALVSPQSQPIASRQILEENVARVRANYPEGNIPRPPHWGGYRLRPTRIEFWQGRPNRLHDRIEYSLDTDSRWIHRRLAP